MNFGDYPRLEARDNRLNFLAVLAAHLSNILGPLFYATRRWRNVWSLRPEHRGSSVAVAILASYTALDMAGRVSARVSNPMKSWIWLVGGAVSMGIGIWSMHFIGMLSFHLPIQLAFSLPITLLSMIIAIAVSAIALLSSVNANLGYVA